MRAPGETVSATVKRVIAEMMGITSDDVKDEQHLGEDIGADSLDCVEIVMALEEEFEVEMPDEEIEGLKTVAQVIEYAKKKVPA